MNKLGFAIKLASQGAGNAIECNKGQWTNKVVDIREYLKLFNGLQGTDNIVTFMSFDEGGCFLTQLRAISGRVGDFLSGWIYIPNTIEASGEEIMSAYNYVRNILSQSNLSDLKDDIESFFSKEYSSKEVAAQYIASRGQLYGVRFLGHYTLKEIVGEHRYQPYYSDYKAVFLLNKEDEVAITKESASNFRNLTDKDIVKTSIIIPPTNASLQALGKGTKIHVADGSDFNQPLLANVGSKVTLFLSRIGFENMKFEVNVSSERQEIDLANVKITWKKKISASMFTVSNRKQEKIEQGVRISVNDKDITFQEILVSEEECRQAIIKVSAPGYEPFEDQRNLLLKESSGITLNGKVITTIELVNGKHAKMTLESEYLPSKYDSPLKGYEFEEKYPGDKVLRMSSWFVWQQRLWGFLGTLAAVMLMVACVAFDAWIDTHHFKFGLPPWEEDKPAKTWQQNANNGAEEAEVTETNDQQVNQQILNYLNQNDQWAKAQLDQDPMTRGLYDMINNYRFSDIMNVNIENCDKINKIKEISQNMINNGCSLSGSYSQDGTITIQKWIDAVNAKYEQQLAIDEGNNGQSDYNQLADVIAKKKAAEEAAKKKAAEAAKKKAAEAAKKKAAEAAKKKAAEEAAKKKAAEKAAKKKENAGL